MTEPAEEMVAMHAEVKEKQTGGRRRGGDRHPFHYRCYSGQTIKIGWRVKSMFTCHLFHMPLSFVWASHDLDGLHRYINALMADRTAEAAFFEDKGFVQDLVYPEHDANVQAVRVNISDFIDLLMMRSHICMPAHRKITFMTYSDRFVPTSFITAISHLPGLEHMANHTEGWEGVQRSEPIGGLKPEDVHTGTGLEHPEMSIASLAPASPAAAAAGAPVADAAAAGEPLSVVATPPESEISRKAREKHFELLTYVRPAGAQPYFVRRLATYSGQLLWAGTSFGIEGPWTEYQRENSLLIGLGIEP
jgi:hypothetical protein